MKKPLAMKPEVFDVLKEIQNMNINASLYSTIRKNEKAFLEMGVSLEDIADILYLKDYVGDFPNPEFYLVYDQWRAQYIYDNLTNPDIKMRGDNEREYLAAVRSWDSRRIEYEQKTEHLSKMVSGSLEKLARRQDILEKEGIGSWEGLLFQVRKAIDKIGILLSKTNEPITDEVTEPLKEDNDDLSSSEYLEKEVPPIVYSNIVQEPEKMVNRSVMANNYKLWTLSNEEKIASDGVTILHRIQANKDFSYVFGVDVVKGEFGGWIENENNLERNSWVGDNAEVYGEAKIVDSAVIENAVVRNNARVTNDSCIAGNAQIMDSACVDNSIVADDAQIKENAVIEKSSVEGYSTIGRNSYVHNCTCSENTHIYESIIQNVDMCGDIIIGNREYDYGKDTDDRDYVNYTAPKLLDNNLLNKLRAQQGNGLIEEVICSGKGKDFIADLKLVEGNYLTMDLSVTHPLIRCNGVVYDAQKILDKLKEMHYSIGELHPKQLMDMLSGKPQSLGTYICVAKQLGEEFILKDVTEKVSNVTEIIDDKSHQIDLREDSFEGRTEDFDIEHQNTNARTEGFAENYPADAKMKSLFAFCGEEKIASDGVTVLHRIQANRDLSFLEEKDVPEGTLGGWIEKEGNLVGYSWVGGDAEVFGQAKVVNSAILGNSIVRDNALVKESTIWGNSLIGGDAEIEESLVSGHAQITGSTVLAKSVYAGYGVIDGNSHLDNCFCRKNVNIYDSNLRYVCMEGDFMLNEEQLDFAAEDNKMKSFGYMPPALLTNAMLEQLRANPEGVKGMTLSIVEGKEFLADLKLVAGEDMRMKLDVSNPIVRCNGVNYDAQKVLYGLVRLNRDITGITPDRLANMMKGEPLQVRSIQYMIQRKGDEYVLLDQRKRINNIELYESKDGGVFIRCMIDGEQHCGKKLSEEATLAFCDKTDRKMLAVDYFMDELRENREVEYSMRR